jgi:hypothetical protein
VTYWFTGAPDPETATAIIACVETVFGAAAPAEPTRIPVWRDASIRENLRSLRPAEPGVNRRAVISGP